MKESKKAGHDTSKMGSAWIVPVYLYKRAHVLKQNFTSHHMDCRFRVSASENIIRTVKVL